LATTHSYYGPQVVKKWQIYLENTDK